MKHKHDWHYSHVVFDGRGKTSEVGVHRHCICGESQMAFASRWRKTPSMYRNVTKSAMPGQGKAGAK